MTELGTEAAPFRMREVTSGQTITLEDFRGSKALLVMFICRHCPFVQHVEREVARLGRDYVSRGVGVVAISSNDPEAYPEDAPNSLREMAENLGFNFPYCYDETQETAKAYGAVCTPDFFLYDQDRLLVYRGQLDDSRPSNSVPVTGRDLRAAIDAVLAGEPIEVEQRPSIGCNIKWRPGSAASTTHA